MKDMVDWLRDNTFAVRPGQSNMLLDCMRFVNSEF